MRKKLLWERIHQLERDISALMKIDEIVTLNVIKASNNPSNHGACDVRQPPASPIPEVESAPQSEYTSKSIKTLFPPSTLLLSPSRVSVSAKQEQGARTQKESSVSETREQRKYPKNAPRKEKSFPNNISRNKQFPAENNRQHSLFTTPNLDMKSAEMRTRRTEPVGGESRPVSAPCAVPCKDTEETKAECLIGEAMAMSPASTQYDQLTCKYEMLLQRLAHETHRRAAAEKLLRGMQQNLEQSRCALGDAQRARVAALEIAQQLRDKYEVLRHARRLAQSNVQVLKSENSNLAEKLETEAARRKALEEGGSGAAGVAAAAKGDEAALRAQLEGERRACEALREDAAAEAVRAQALRRLVEELEGQATQQRCRADALEKELDEERKKRFSTDDPDFQAAVESATRSLGVRLEERARQVQDAEARARALLGRLEVAQAETKSAAQAAEAAAASAATAEAAMRARETREPLRADDPEVRELLAVETQRLMEELKRQADDAREQRSRCDDLQRQMHEQQAAEEHRVHALEEEHRRARTALGCKDELLLRERDELQSLVRDLNDALRIAKAQVDDLTQAAQRREGMLRKQAQALASKDERLCVAEREVVALRERASTLRKESVHAAESLRALRRTNEELARRVEASRRCAHCEALQQRLTDAQEELRHWKEKAETHLDNLRIKDKIIEDQMTSIRRLKEQRQEEKEAAARDRQALQGDLAKERRSTQRMREELKVVYRRCQQQAERAERLEQELSEAEMADNSGRAHLEQQQRLLDHLEREVLEQRRVWDEKVARLVKDKQMAVDAAEFAAKRLEETLVEFERQAVSQRKVQQVVAAQLAQREKELEEARKTVRLLNRPDGHAYASGDDARWPLAPLPPPMPSADTARK